MKLKIVSTLFLFVGLALSGPISRERITLVVTKDSYADRLVIYTSQNDIVNIFTPLNLNIDMDADDDDSSETDSVIFFFVEKDLASGEDRGLFIRNNNKVTKLLPKGRDMAASATNDNKNVYFAASDGIYNYNLKENKAEKYGTVTDDLINIAVGNTSDVIYVLTKNKKLFKVTENGEKQVKISDVSNAEQIVMDYSNNLYFVTTNKDVYVINEGGVKKIEGLPGNSNKLTLLRPPFVIGNGVPLVVDNKSFIIYANGKTDSAYVEIEAIPTAYSIEGTFMQHYAYNKKIYEHDMLGIAFKDDYHIIKKYLYDRMDYILSTATRYRYALKNNNQTSKKNKQ